ncbi:MAG: DNA double-strand break repair nuclease NurA [Candidatus Heimdallarchaeota archaeon]|nr:MAG: DNA double-strand break repair nuclease NurA [Candidatus Heimdallarchaeota archaeon]
MEPNYSLLKALITSRRVLFIHSIVENAFSAIDVYLTEITKLNEDKIKFCNGLRESNPDFTDLPPHLRSLTCDNHLITQLVPQNISGLTIGGIDGGYTSRLLIGFDILVFRAVAVFLTYTPEGIQKTTYYPNKTPPLEIAISNVGLSSLEFESMGSIRRAITELHVASQVIEQNIKKVDILLMDGSPVMKKPNTTNKKVLDYYQTYISTLSRLISQAQKYRVKLAWIVKDSRLNLFTKFLGKILPFVADEFPDLTSLDYRSIINQSRDMDLFYYILESNVRSLAYLRQFDISVELNEKYALYAYYLKTAPFDIPLRIEIFHPIHRTQANLIKNIDAISEAILPISQYNKNYGVPAPIVEADARAKIKEKELEALFQLIRIRHPTPDLWFYRRERSPWGF